MQPHVTWPPGALLMFLPIKTSISLVKYGEIDFFCPWLLGLSHRKCLWDHEALPSQISDHLDNIQKILLWASPRIIAPCSLNWYQLFQQSLNLKMNKSCWDLWTIWLPYVTAQWSLIFKIIKQQKHKVNIELLPNDDLATLDIWPQLANQLSSGICHNKQLIITTKLDIWWSIFINLFIVYVTLENWQELARTGNWLWRVFGHCRWNGNKNLHNLHLVQLNSSRKSTFSCMCSHWK